MLSLKGSDFTDRSFCSKSRRARVALAGKSDTTEDEKKGNKVHHKQIRVRQDAKRSCEGKKKSQDSIQIAISGQIRISALGQKLLRWTNAFFN